MTNREAHEEAAGMGLEESFFRISGIDPKAEYRPAKKPFEWVEVLNECIAKGKNHADLIDWAPAQDLFGASSQDPLASIEAAKGELTDRGWIWNPAMQRMESDGWYVWFRSQVKLGDLYT